MINVGILRFIKKKIKMYKYFGLVFIIRLQIPSWLIHIDGLGIVRGFLRFIFTNLKYKHNLSRKTKTIQRNIYIIG